MQGQWYYLTCAGPEETERRGECGKHFQYPEQLKSGKVTNICSLSICDNSLIQ